MRWLVCCNDQLNPSPEAVVRSFTVAVRFWPVAAVAVQLYAGADEHWSRCIQSTKNTSLRLKASFIAEGVLACSRKNSMCSAILGKRPEKNLAKECPELLL